MGFDLFMTVAAIVAAAVATWAILRLFLSENDDIAPPTNASPMTSPPRITPKITPKSRRGSRRNTPKRHRQASRHRNHTDRSHIHRNHADIRRHHTSPLADQSMLHAIIATPVMFYCAAPMHNRGTAALKSHTPNADSLLSLAMTIVYVYSLLACVVSWIFPAGSRNQYFAFASMVAVLSLAISLIAQRPMAKKASEGDIPTAQSQEKQEIQSQETRETQQSMDTLIQASITYEIRTRVTQITATVTMVIAVWTFALWLIFGLQPKLAIAVLIGATVLTVAGLVLQAYDRQPSR